MTTTQHEDRPTTRVRLIHTSQQFSDPDDQHAHDAEAVFAYAAKREAIAITGTEAGAGAGNLTRELLEAAGDHGYRFHRGHGDWLGVRRDLGKVIGRGYVKVLESHDASGDPAPGNYAPKGIPWLKVDATDQGLGVLAVSASHFLTKGQSPGGTPAGPLNHHTLNLKLGRAVGAWFERHGKGTALAFHGSDTNLIDRKVDAVPGAVSCWDERKFWPNTGHGNIDVLYRNARDGRVRWVDAKVLDDRRLKLYTDHHLIEATAEVRLLKAGR